MNTPAKPPNHPWNVLPMLDRGSTQRQLHTAVGAALSSWEGMEFAMSELYAALINARSDAAVAGYGTIESFRGRFGLVDQAEQFFSGRQDAPHNLMHNTLREISAFAARRNEIAHGVAADVAGRGWFLTPAWYNTKKAPREGGFTSRNNFGIGTFAYTAEQIDYYRGEFHRLDSAVAAHTRAVTKWWWDWKGFE